VKNVSDRDANAVVLKHERVVFGVFQRNPRLVDPGENVLGVS
jgi:hypothetical protein